MGNLVKHSSDKITYKVIGLAMEVHSRLGPGLKEQIYQRAMEEALESENMIYEPQRQMEVYFGQRLVGLLFMDILVENCVVIELKALSNMVTNNELAQVITYLKVGGYEIGLLLNFGRKFLQYKRIFPPNNVTEVTEEDLRFGVKVDPKYAKKRSMSDRYIR